LSDPAEKTVHTWDEPCTCCEGSGKILRVDGLDLRRLREKHGVSLPSFCARVKRPGKKVEGVTVAFVSEVERGNKNCPEWLYGEYLRIPKIRYRKKKGLPQGLREAVEASKVKAESKSKRRKA
jgi:hypothetical protein